MKNKIIKILSLLLVTVFIAVYALISLNTDQTLLHVDYLDVGQGDSTFITTPGGVQILVDGGPDDAVLEQLRRVMPVGDSTIDWLVMSHSDADHLTGLIDVVQNYQVSRIVMQDFDNDTILYLGWLKLLEEKNIQVSKIKKAQDIIIDNGLEISFYDVAHMETGLINDVNNASLVFEVKYGGVSFLFTGDIEKIAEDELLKYYSKDLQSTVLKVAHHGSKTSSSPEFLNAVKPDLAVIQVGKDNDFGHPSLRVLYRLMQRNIRFWRNDSRGMISFITDGQSVWLKNGGIGLFPQIFGQNSEKVYNVANN